MLPNVEISCLVGSRPPLEMRSVMQTIVQLGLADERFSGIMNQYGLL